MENFDRAAWSATTPDWWHSLPQCHLICSWLRVLQLFGSSSETTILWSEFTALTGKSRQHHRNPHWNDWEAMERIARLDWSIYCLSCPPADLSEHGLQQSRNQWRAIIICSFGCNVSLCEIDHHHSTSFRAGCSTKNGCEESKLTCAYMQRWLE